MAIKVDKLLKVYKSNKGAYVCALKDISFNLPDTGMVFILGKSGCGKSTLLNLLGGLDGFDGGDIIVDGKSIKDYKAKDLDGYRNDYIGFVFQENNLIEKESVRRNISLALDLQSSKDTEGKVDGILERIGLKDLAEKKCNCISGGQKQRVAIARALIKSPKLLLCDEPTGALDSETGEEIFTLLKELSQDRLVVVVSHDRESAEQYGDRVIELKDGEIISDSAPLESKEQTSQPTEKKKHGGLRFTRAFTLGAGYIIAKPIRMAICLLLCLITFTCIGVIDTVFAYDRDKAILYTMDELDSKCYAFGKAFNLDNKKFILSIPFMTMEEADELSELLDVERCDYIYNFTRFDDGARLSDVEGLLTENYMIHYARTRGYVEAYGSFLDDYGYKLVAGRLPENTGEVALPLYLFNFFKAYGYKNEDNVVNINSYDDLISKTLTFSTYNFNMPSLIVTGIVDTNYVFEKQAKVLFEGAKIYGDESGSDFEMDILDIEMDAIHNALFVCEGFNEYFSENINSNRDKSCVLRVIAPYKGSNAQKLKNIRVYTTQYNGKPVQVVDESHKNVCYHLVNYCGKKIWDAENTFKRIQDYSVYVIAATVTITVLFLMYYASGTINEKRREIGILRALGASRGDIVKITACEHGIFALGGVAISSVIAAILTVLLNNSYTKEYGLGTSFISFGIRQIAVIAAVAVAAVVVGIAIPLIKLLKKKPVDVIADRK